PCTNWKGAAKKLAGLRTRGRSERDAAGSEPAARCLRRKPRTAPGPFPPRALASAARLFQGALSRIVASSESPAIALL
ncbi:Hypothetical predicted protein, partial [Marmota monax]